jgi:hypothetical protein
MFLIFQVNTFSLKEEMGFNDEEMRSLLLKAPKLWMKSKLLNLHFCNKEMLVKDTAGVF